MRSRFIYPRDLLRNWTPTKKRRMCRMRTIRSSIICMHTYTHISNIIGTGKLPRFLDIVPFSSMIYLRNCTPPFSPLYAASFNRSFIQNAKSMNVIFGESWRPRATDALFSFFYTLTRTHAFRHLPCVFPRFPLFSLPVPFSFPPCSARHRFSKRRCRIRGDLKSIETPAT